MTRALRKLFIDCFSLPVLLFTFCLWIPSYIVLVELGATLSTLNIVTLLVILIGCLGVTTVRITMVPMRLWFPITWFLLTTGVYYGFGPLVYYCGTSETIDYINAYYPLTDVVIFRTNILTLIGVTGVIGTYLLLKNTFALKGGRNAHYEIKESRFDKRTLCAISLIFVLIGVPIKIFFVLPYVLGLSTVVLPGSIQAFGVFSTLAMIPLSLLTSRWRGYYRIAFSVLILFELITAFIQLRKLELLVMLIVLVLAKVMQGTTFRQLAWIGVLSVLAYAMILTPIVMYGRIAFNVKGLRETSEMVQLVQNFNSGYLKDNLEIVLPGVQSWWGRLSYANAQAFAIDAYETGQPGDTLMLAVWVMVPRLLYPDKPHTTTGDKFNELVTGSAESNSAPGMFAEGYWNAGWPGLFFVVVVMAFFYWGWERYTQARLASGKIMQYLPVIWVGLSPAMRQDSWFIPGTIGVLPIAFVFHWLGRLLVFRRIPLGVR